jgi:hypothetical protein
MPVITSRKQEPVQSKSDSITIRPDTAIGSVVYTNRCGRCHDLPQINKYSWERWETILATMMPRARLNATQRVHVAGYVKSRTKDLMR